STTSSGSTTSNGSTTSSGSSTSNSSGSTSDGWVVVNSDDNITIWSYQGTSGSSDSGSTSSGSSSSGSSSGSVSSDVSVSDSDTIISGISSRYISESELYGYSLSELRLIRNEIFALHGRMFQSEDLQEYFNQKSWYTALYTPEEFDANMFSYLNEYEKANLNVIIAYEESLGG
ncbi:MAG: YARHG domain-containing protein, partial [Lachnospiraceae bacterium]|nr:YARHG domain-containing protein [Lachnospiraceae bacterium]